MPVRPLSSLTVRRTVLAVAILAPTAEAAAQTDLTVRDFASYSASAACRTTRAAGAAVSPPAPLRTSSTATAILGFLTGA